MKIACNYYAETEQLVDEEKIYIDYYKFPSLGYQMDIMQDISIFEQFARNISAKKPILLHGLYPTPHDLSSPTLQSDFNHEVVRRMIKATKTPGLSFHAALNRLNSDIPFTKTLSTIISNAAYIKENYHHLDFVSIENADSIVWGDLIKPEIITRMINESGCSFLLDISHAYCASRWLNMNFPEYLRKLPLEKVYEIHINGWIEKGNDIMCHTKINQKGYEALKEVLQHCKPKIITVEYGRHNDKIGSGIPVMSPDRINEKAKEEIVEQVYRIREIVEGAD